MAYNDFLYRLDANTEIPKPSPAMEIRSYMVARRMTQKEFAKRIRVSTGAVAQWLSGKRKVPGPVLAYIDLVNGYARLEANRRNPTCYEYKALLREQPRNPNPSEYDDLIREQMAVTFTEKPIQDGQLAHS